jgi:rhamnogalacturonan endolyase
MKSIAFRSSSGVPVALLSLALALFFASGNLLAAFSLTTNSGYYQVDTGAGLVFRVATSDGSINYLSYNGINYQEPSKGTHVNSGIGGVLTNNSISVVATNISNSFAKITVTVTNSTDKFVHYYIARNGYSQIVMADWFTTEPQDYGLCRFIVRIPSNLMPNGPEPSRTYDTDIGIEGGPDIFAYSSTNSKVALRGQTRSKHYSNHRLIDWRYTGEVNNTTAMAGVWMVRSNHEGDSGGPFWRCLINQSAEVYEIINYGECQTEFPFRNHVLNGPYMLVFTPGTPPPSVIDTSWLTNSAFNLIGYVPDSKRGRVVGIASGVPNGFEAVVAFANPNAQYWCIATNGAFTSPLMIPGTYNQILYKGELAVATNSVTVGTNSTVAANIASREYKSPLQTWRIGEWDGSPAGFLNAGRATNGLYANDLMCTTMHPSDVRMASWTATACSTNPYVIGTSLPSQFPCYQWMGVNNPVVVQFNLTPAQIRNHTLRIGITVSYAGGRHVVSLNNGKWTSAIPASSAQPDTRSLTVGTYRGNNTTFTYSIPASAFVAGTNTMTLSLVSGSMVAGATWLSPCISFDCVELD